MYIATDSFTEQKLILNKCTGMRYWWTNYA